MLSKFILFLIKYINTFFIKSKTFDNTSNKEISTISYEKKSTKLTSLIPIKNNILTLDNAQTKFSRFYKNIQLKEKFQIPLFILVVILIMFYILHTNANKTNSSYFDISAYKDKYMFKETRWNTNPILTDIIQINNAENIMKKNLEDKNKRIENVLLVYLNILKSYTGENIYGSAIGYDQIIADPNKIYPYIIKNGLVYKYISRGTEEIIYDTEKDIIDIGYYKIIKPLNNSLLLSYYGEGSYSFLIDYEYLYQTYGKYLSDDYRNYLKIKAQELAIMDYRRMHSDGYLIVNESILVDGILEREKYFSSMNYSELRDLIKDEIRIYTSNVLWNKTTFNYQNGIINYNAKSAYEKLLKYADKSSEEYKVTNKAYHILKANNFKSSEDFRITLDKYLYKEFQNYNDY